MEQLIERIAQAANIAPDTARSTIGLILNFVEKEAPEQAHSLIASIPGATDLMATTPQSGSGGIGGLLGGLLGSFGGSSGNLMALGSQLLGQGLSMDQAKTVASEVLDFGRQHLGEEKTAELIKSIPGLSHIL